MGCLVWFALVLVIVVVFLILRPTIARAIQGSGLASLFRPATAEPAPTATPSAVGTVATDATDTAPSEPAPAATVRVTPAPAAQTPAAPPAVPTPTSSPAPGPQTRTAPATAKPATPTTERRASPARHQRQSVLYFLQKDSEGVTLRALSREVTYTDSPLTDTLEALLAGPSTAEKEKGYLSLIPEGTRVESVQVRGDTAYVSFNERFRLNPYGRDGLAAQLKQVVWTATEFSTVKTVQILIGGAVTDYLGPEGLRIRDPLSRQSLADL